MLVLWKTPSYNPHIDGHVTKVDNQSAGGIFREQVQRLPEAEEPAQQNGIQGLLGNSEGRMDGLIWLESRGRSAGKGSAESGESK